MAYAHNKWTRQPFPSPAAVAAGGLALIMLVLAWLVLTDTPERIRAPGSLMAHLDSHARAAAPSIAPSKPARLVYRYSVLPGGVHSAAELAAALRSDPVASAHFAGFNVAAARVLHVEQSRLVHVSYRIGDKIYWTKHKVRLAAGEELLSDGTHLVRARCGNRIADEPQALMLDNEPAPEGLDALMVSAEGLIDEAPPMAAVSNAVSPAAAAAAVEQPLRLASNVQDGTPSPYISLRIPSTVARFTPPAAASMPALPPSGAAGTDVPGSTLPETPAQPIAPPRPASPARLPPGPSLPSPFPVPPAAPSPTPPLPDWPAELPPGPPPGPQLHNPAVPPAAPTEIPEPGSAALAAMALAAMALARRRAGRRPAVHAQAR